MHASLTVSPPSPRKVNATSSPRTTSASAGGRGASYPADGGRPVFVAAPPPVASTAAAAGGVGGGAGSSVERAQARRVLEQRIATPRDAEAAEEILRCDVLADEAEDFAADLAPALATFLLREDAYYRADLALFQRVHFLTLHLDAAEMEELAVRTSMYRQFEFERELLQESQLMLLERKTRRDIEGEFKAWAAQLLMFLAAPPSEYDMIRAICNGDMTERAARLVIEFHARMGNLPELRAGGAGGPRGGTFWDMMLREQERIERAALRKGAEREREWERFQQLKNAIFRGGGNQPFSDEFFRFYFENYFLKDGGRKQPFKISQSVDRKLNKVTPHFEKQLEEKERRRREATLQDLSKQLLGLQQRPSSSANRPPMAAGSARSRSGSASRGGSARSRGGQPPAPRDWDDASVSTDVLESFFMPSLLPTERNGWRPVPYNRSHSPGALPPPSPRGGSAARSHSQHQRLPSLPAYERGSGRHQERPYFTTHFTDANGARTSSADGRQRSARAGSAASSQQQQPTSAGGGVDSWRPGTSSGRLTPFEQNQLLFDQLRQLPRAGSGAEGDDPAETMIPSEYFDYLMGKRAEQDRADREAAQRAQRRRAALERETAAEAQAAREVFFEWKAAEEARRGLDPVPISDAPADNWIWYFSFYHAVATWRDELVCSPDLREWLQPSAEYVNAHAPSLCVDLCRGFDRL